MLQQVIRKEKHRDDKKHEMKTKIKANKDHEQFYIGKTIGVGTYSKVCLALVKSKDRGHQIIACKIINKKRAGSEFMQKFLPREIKILSKINHPNIVSLLEFKESRNNIFLLMTYCQYGDLLELVKDYGPLSERKSREYFRQLVSAMFYLHYKDVAHRDLKCENIFLYDKNTIKIGDFGFARYCENDKGNSAKNLSKTYCGSAAYAAPEVIMGKPYNPKMYDVWSLGVILYIMITAQMPFDDSNANKMLQIQLQRLVVKNILNFEKSYNVKILLKQLLEPDVDKRLTVYQITKSKWLKETTKKHETKKKLGNVIWQ